MDGWEDSDEEELVNLALQAEYEHTLNFDVDNELTEQAFSQEDVPPSMSAGKHEENW